MSEIRYYKVSSTRMVSDAYYAAYIEQSVFEQASFDYTLSASLDITEISADSIPPAAIVHRAGLSHADAREVTRLFPGELFEVWSRSDDQ